MKTFIVKYEARADKEVEIVEYDTFDDVCEYIIQRYKEGNPIVIGETERFVIWVSDPTFQLHVSYKAQGGKESC